MSVLPYDRIVRSLFGRLCGLDKDGYLIAKGLPYTLRHFGDDGDAAAEAAFAAGAPLVLESAGTAILRIDPTADATTATDAGRGDVIEAACAWQQTCVHGPGQVVVQVAAGDHHVEGQVLRGSFSTPFDGPPLIVQAAAMPAAATTHPIAGSANSIAFSAQKKQVTHINVSASSGWTSAPSVVFDNTGTGGSDAAATAYVRSDGGLAVVVTNGGSAYDTAPTVSFSGGVGGTATATAVINTHIYTATITQTNALPSNIAVGMPIGVSLVRGTNDCGAINGGQIITAFDTVAKTISFDMCAPFAGTLTTGTASAGGVSFPTSWLTVTGGYSGATTGAEAFWNANQSAHIKIRGLGMAWTQAGQNQGPKTQQSAFSGGNGFGNFHTEQRVIAAGFPNAVLRSNACDGWHTFPYWGGATTGTSVVVLQGGGGAKVSGGAFGSCKNQVATVGRGTFFEVSGADFGSGGAAAIDNVGGTVDCQGSDFFSSIRAVRSQLSGVVYGSSTCTIDRCETAIDWLTGGRVYLDVTPTNSITQDSPYPRGVMSRAGGGWFAASSGTASEARVVTVGAKVGTTAGWVVGAANNLGLLATLPEGQTASTLVVPLPAKLYETITGVYAIGQIEASGGGDVSITVNLRKLTAAAADVTDASVGTVTLNHTAAADVILSSANAGVTGLTEVVAADETFYALITATTAAGSDIALQAIALTVAVVD